MSKTKLNTNRESKDRLFKFIFGNEKCKEWTLALYNAINHSNYNAACAIELNTIDDVLYVGMHNDVSFIVENTMNMYEHQSTFNPNMPLRFLIYASMLYSKYVEKSNKYQMFNRKLKKVPTPKCICFYNGTDEIEDEVVLKLSDAVGEDTDIEVTVKMININYGHNKELLDSCAPLMEYSWFVQKIREKAKLFGIADAVDKSLQEMPDSFGIKAFLVANKAEVTIMCLTEYDFEEHMKEERADAREERDEEIAARMRDLGYSDEEIKKVLEE